MALSHMHLRISHLLRARHALQTREGQDTLPRARQNRYTRDGLLQLENAELQQILVDMEVPVGTKRTRDVMLDRILVRQLS